MTNKVVGGILLVLGTSIGGGMLALPIATAAGGFYHSLLLFLGAWFVTLLSAFFILEVNLWLPEDANLISMAKATLGPIGQSLTWVIYLLLLYTLLAAYIAGGADLIHNFLGLIQLNSPRWVDTVLFIMLFGSILYYGVSAVDWANRGLMSVKLITFILLILFIMPEVKFTQLSGGKTVLLSSAVMVVITSFGYGTIIPTLRHYFRGHVNALRWTIAVGSLIPLICYLLWNLAIQGSVSAEGSNGLVAMGHSDKAVSDLTSTLIAQHHNPIIGLIIRTFMSICIATSFLGVSLCLSDFLSDGLKISAHKLGKKRLLVVGLTLFPSTVIILFHPGLYILSLNYAGICCVLLLMLLPSLMLWNGRYVKNIATGYRVFGGKPLIVIEMIIATVLLIFAALSLK